MQSPRWNGLFVANQVHRVRWRRTLKGDAGGQKLVKNDAQGMNVDGRAGVFPRDLLGGHVLRSTHGNARLRDESATDIALQIDPLREAEVRDLRFARTGQKYIGRFQIAMNDADPVGRVSRPRQRRDHSSREFWSLR